MSFKVTVISVYRYIRNISIFRYMSFTCTVIVHFIRSIHQSEGAQWLSCRVLDLRPKGRGLEPHWRHCVVSLSKNINPCLVLVQPRKTRPFITEKLWMGRKESNQTNNTSITRSDSSDRGENLLMDSKINMAFFYLLYVC